MDIQIQLQTKYSMLKDDKSEKQSLLKLNEL